LCRSPEPRAAAKRAGYREPHRDDLRPGAVYGYRGEEVKALGVTRFFKEQFFTPVAEAATSG
jgi:hypothetical protein